MNTMEYMEGLVDQRDAIVMKEKMLKVIKEFRNEGFEDEDIYDYIKDIVLMMMHGKTYKNIEDMLKKEREQFIKNNTK